MEISDNVTGTQVQSYINTGTKVASYAAPVLKGIRDRAKAKTAQKVSDAGNYMTLNPYSKSLIAIPQYILQMAANEGNDPLEYKNAEAMDIGTVQAMNNSNTTIADTVSLGTDILNVLTGKTVTVPKNAPAPPPVNPIIKYIPYIIGVIVLGLVIYFIARRKK